MRLLVQFLPYRGAMGRHLDVLRKSPIRYVFAITIVNAIVCAVVAANRKDLFIQPLHGYPNDDSRARYPAPWEQQLNTVIDDYQLLAIVFDRRAEPRLCHVQRCE